MSQVVLAEVIAETAQAVLAEENTVAVVAKAEESGAVVVVAPVPRRLQNRTHPRVSHHRQRRRGRVGLRTTDLSRSEFCAD